ncbi:acetyl-CoA hydrolase/transferase family protein [Sporomusa termitida]|uniref:Butanoate coenzyme A-transferase n=1 Tax=Sporomusa termitida TaxID=2377 RepID=A0A517DSG3_9FIRM|nr:acetyl-CoA hydrolase/transferase C-terminal domain-containing protein [Sporomusa termitida]QDR80301.1 Butanoate coenzyme A-transferase [Sporomusa termitida]
MNTYAEQYQSKLTIPNQIAAQIQSGQHIFTDIALSQPKAISDAIGVRVAVEGLTGVIMNTMLDLYPMPCYQSEMAGKLTGISWFSSAGARKAINNGYGDVLPGYYRDFPRVIRDNLDIDVFCAAVAPMDKHGYFSMSTVGSLSKALIGKAKYIYLEVNKNLPRSLSAPVIHISQVNALCESTMPLISFPPTKMNETSIKIGELIANEIPNGATLQLGIGTIPEAVGLALKSKKNLGIHTEMFTDSMIELIECGAVDNNCKPIHQGKSVTTFALGSQRIYDYIDDNPAIEVLPVDYVNDPAVIAQHPNFISINSALEVDFYGQVCAESVGTNHVSGTGGQLDYVRGAVQSKGGQSFLAFFSTAKNDTISKIVPTLTSGAIVSTGKNDVDNIVTEYGIARLRGRSLSARTKALIAIAHPKFRDELIFAAKKINIII